MADDNLTAQRRGKLDALAALGLPVYNVDFRPDHTMEQALQELQAWESGPAPAGDAREGPSVAVAGRLMLQRLQGKSCFSHVEDETGRMQVWFRLDRLDDTLFEAVK